MTSDGKNDKPYTGNVSDNDNRDSSRDRRITQKADAVRTDWFKRGDINKTHKV